MTQSELRYMISIRSLAHNENGVKLTEIAEKTGVTKVSVYRAVERLEKNGYITRNDKNKVVMTEQGKSVLAEYIALANVMQQHLEQRFGTPKEEAYEESLGVVCALGDFSRARVREFAERNLDSDNKLKS